VGLPRRLRGGGLLGRAELGDLDLHGGLGLALGGQVGEYTGAVGGVEPHRLRRRGAALGQLDAVEPAGLRVRIGELLEHVGDRGGHGLRGVGAERAVGALAGLAHAPLLLVTDGDGLRPPAVDLELLHQHPRDGGVVERRRAAFVQERQPGLPVRAGPFDQGLVGHGLAAR
jgi:hypothetical protein